jgi:hypothetical protein
MTNSAPATSALALPQDALNRDPYLTNLAKLINRLDKGVIAIDGEWGSGKSWAGQKLKDKLDQQRSAKTIWLDVFEADWSDDPAVSLIAAIAQHLEPAKSDSFLDKAAPVLTAVLPLATKTIAKAALSYVGVDKELTEELAQIGQSQADKYIKKHLQEASQKSKNLKQLKDLLNETVAQTTEKLVIFVDELDRCSPGFAVRMLERLKHLFDLEGVIYVLLWNRTQVARTVEAFYGAGSDGQMFLDKFIDIPLHLPVSQTSHRRLPHEDLIHSISMVVDGKQRAGTEQLLINDNVHLLANFAHILNLTARETKRLTAWWAMSQNRPYPVIDTWLLALKVKSPQTFAEIRDSNLNGHIKARELLIKKQPDAALNKEVIKALIDIHL